MNERVSGVGALPECQCRCRGRCEVMSCYATYAVSMSVTVLKEREGGWRGGLYCGLTNLTHIIVKVHTLHHSSYYLVLRNGDEQWMKPARLNFSIFGYSI